MYSTNGFEFEHKKRDVKVLSIRLEWKLSIIWFIKIWVAGTITKLKNWILLTFYCFKGL